MFKGSNLQALPAFRLSVLIFAAAVPLCIGLSGEAGSALAQDNIAAPAAAVQVLGRNTIADIAEKVAPAVVNIEMDSVGGAAGVPGNFKFYFNGKEVKPGEQGPFGKPGGMPGMPQFQINPGGGGHVQNAGSGVIVRPDGYILTNAHVVKGGGKITVKLNDQRTFAGTVIGIDSFSDLAVVKINGDNLPTVKLGSSTNLRPGDFVIAIGNPFGFDHTVTFGIISAIKRSVTDVNGNINFIQTDAAINPGNSGGPLINLDGEVVGVNTAIKSNAQNIGFSIPIDIAKDVVESLIAHKTIDRPWLGIGMRLLDQTMVKSQGLPADTHGVLVYSIMDGSPAKTAGIQPGDIIVKIDGKGFDSPHDVQEYVRSHKVKDTLHLYLFRQGSPQAVAITIDQYPEPASDVVAVPSNSPNKPDSSKPDSSKPDSSKDDEENAPDNSGGSGGDEN
jgi:serine protease Do